jgi:hypothetical protein
MVFDINIPPLDKISNSSYGPIKEWDILYCPCQEGKLKNFISYKNSKLETCSDFGNTIAFKFLYEFAFNSTNLSPITNPESQRYQYPVCPAQAGPPSIPYPDSKVQREALDCPARGPFMAST